MTPSRVATNAALHPANRHDLVRPRPLGSGPLAGEPLVLDLRRWDVPASAEERSLLATVRGPVIDVGCGPGRVVETLTDRGVVALGVDLSPSAIALGRRRGAAVIRRNVFRRLPGEGRWATVLLFDGNVGIGGDPTRLLGRCQQLTGGRGRVVAEVGPPGPGWCRTTARLEVDGRRSPEFAWAVVGVDAIAHVAGPAGLRVSATRTTCTGRWFAFMEPADR